MDMRALALVLGLLVAMVPDRISVAEQQESALDQAVSMTLRDGETERLRPWLLNAEDMRTLQKSAGRSSAIEPPANDDDLARAVVRNSNDVILSVSDTRHYARAFGINLAHCELRQAPDLHLVVSATGVNVSVFVPSAQVGAGHSRRLSGPWVATTLTADEIGRLRQLLAGIAPAISKLRPNCSWKVGLRRSCCGIWG